jgi:hypothetical protein
VSTLGSARRYYLAKRHAATALCDTALAMVWRGKQEAEPGDPLPDNFVYVERLETAGYTTYADLDGADSDELVEQGFTTREAAAILAAAAEA